VDRPQSVTRALANMVGAAVAFAILNAAVKSLRGEIPTIQLVWVRTLGHLLFMVAAFAPRHGLKLFATRHPAFQLVRSCLLLASTAFYFTALGFVGLATAAAISFMTPCLIAVLAGPVLGERVGPRRWGVVVIGFLGVLVGARPGADLVNLASLLVLGSATASALYDLLTRRLVATDPPETTVAYAAVVGAAALAVVMPVAWTSPRSWGSLAIMLSLGLWGGLGHYFMPARTGAPPRRGSRPSATSSS
jgi:drug/metabolite transporter (DMT)-like permease